MAQPTWRELKKVTVPDKPGNAWTPALDYVTPGKLYLIEAAETPKWKPESGTECTADGDAALTRSTAAVLDTAPVGALIGKIGGSTADMKPNKELVIFSVGRHCVFSVADAAKAGTLYLAMNDVPASQSKVGNSIEVTIHEGL